jgi:ABC-2 type transport system ATP-binding protein
MDVISCEGLTKTFGRVKAVSELSFTIEENRITGLIGPNGAGKTTLLKIIAGYMRASSGQITVFSENPFNSLKVSSNMIFIDENMKFAPSFSLSEISQKTDHYSAPSSSTGYFLCATMCYVVLHCIIGGITLII